MDIKISGKHKCKAKVKVIFNDTKFGIRLCVYVRKTFSENSRFECIDILSLIKAYLEFKHSYIKL